MKFAQRQAALLEQLSYLPNAQEQLMWLTQPSKDARWLLPEAERHPSLLVPGCVSPVWLHGTRVGSAHHFRCAADSVLVAGLVLAQVKLADGLSQAELAEAEFTWITQSGLHHHISPTRLRGLAAVAAALVRCTRSL